MSREHLSLGSANVGHIDTVLEQLLENTPSNHVNNCLLELV
jgi:hypothetical protein